MPKETGPRESREHFIPAQPGWYLLRTANLDSDEKITAYEEPIIGWRITSEKGGGQNHVISTDPVTIEGCNPDSDVFILRPDGKVTRVSDATWDSKEQYLAEMEETRKRRLAQPNT